MKELYLKSRVNFGLVTMWSFNVSHSTYLGSASQALDGVVLVSNRLIDYTYFISALNRFDVIP